MAKRRANGEGTIFQRKDGRWVGQMLRGGRWLRKYGKTQQEVKDWLLEVRKQVADGFEFTANKTTVGEYLEHWLETAQPGLRHNTWVMYKQVVRDHILPGIGGVKLTALRPDHIQRLCAARAAAGVGSSTIRKMHVCLHRALGQATLWGLVPRNVASLVDKPRLKAKADRQPLTPAEVQRLLVACRGHRMEVLLYLAIVTGLREGELLGLRWSDVDWERQSLSVSRQVQRLRGGGGIVYAPVKTRAGSRLVALGPDAMEMLRMQRGRVDQMRRVAGEGWKEHDLVFPSMVGTPLEPGRVWRTLQQMLDKAGVQRVRVHDLRHTSATLMLLQGVHPKVVQERLGHSSINVTMDVYSHVINGMQADAAVSIEAAVRPVAMEVPERAGVGS